MLTGMTNATDTAHSTGQVADQPKGQTFWQLQNLIVLLITGGKGGVGKTTVTANLGAMLALAGYRVLLIDAEQQGNLTTDDLGLSEEDPRNDLGKNLAIVTTYGGEPLKPVNMRENLDLIPGGRYLSNIVPTMIQTADQNAAATNLRAAIADLADDYDYVIIDSPPGEMMFVNMIMRVASHLLIPAGEDRSSVGGIRTLGGRYMTAKDEGAEIELVGVLPFGLNPQATRRNPETRKKLAEIVGDDGVFDSFVPHAAAAAIDLRELHLTAAELVDKQDAIKAEWREATRSGSDKSKAPRMWARDTNPLAVAYQKITVEFLQRLAGTYQTQNPADSNDEHAESAPPAEPESAAAEQK